jgi:hypothetical protein
MPGHGFKAAMLNGGNIPGGLMTLAGRAFNLALKLPGISSLAMASARVAVRAREAMLDIDMTAWQDYELDWLPDAAIFRVNGREVLRAPSPPRGPLGFVAWVDNYRATAASGEYQFAYVEVAEPQWMELEIVAIMGGND